MLDVIKSQLEANIAANRAVFHGVVGCPPALLALFDALAPPTSTVRWLDPASSDELVVEATPADRAFAGRVSGRLEEMAVSVSLREREARLSFVLEVQVVATITGLDGRFAMQSRMEGADLWFILLSSGSAPAQSLDQIAAALGLDTRLTAAYGVFSMGGLSARTLSLAFSVESLACLGITVDGATTVSGIDMTVGVEFSQETRLFGAAEHIELNLTQLLAQCGFDPLDLPALQLEQLGVNAVLEMGHVMFSAKTEPGWQLAGGNAAISLPSVFLFVDRGPHGSGIDLALDFDLGGEELTLSGSVESDGGFAVQGELSSDTGIQILTLIENLAGPDFPVDLPLPDLVLDEITVGIGRRGGQAGYHFWTAAEASTPWALPVAGLSVSDMDAELGYDSTSGLSGRIAGTLSLAGARFTVDYEFPGAFALAGRIDALSLSPLVQALCGTSAVLGLPVPTEALALDLHDLDFVLDIDDRRFDIAATVPGFGRGQLAVRGSAFAFGIAIAQSWRPSQLNGALAALDGLALSNTKLVIATSASAPTPASIAMPGSPLTRGLTLYTTLDLTGLGADLILGRTVLDLSASIGTNPATMALDAQLAGRVVLNDGVIMTQSILRIRPAGPSIAVVGVVEVLLSGTTLEFTGALEIEPRSANLQATLEGTWNEPFGISGVVLADVALELGVSYPPVVPRIGIAASVRIGSIAGTAAVQFDAAQPGNCMIALAFNRLSMMDVIANLGGSQVAGAIPGPLQTLLDGLSWSDVDIYIVPQGTYVGSIYFPPGFRLQGRLTVLGVSAFARVEISQGASIQAEGEVDVVSVLGMFKLTGAGGSGKARLFLDLGLGRTPRFDLSGAVELLGMRADAVVRLSGSGFEFEASGKLFNAFSGTIRASGGSLGNDVGFSLEVTMKSDLIGYMVTQTIAVIRDITSAATRQITDAQAALDAAKADLSRLDRDIANARAVVKRERDRLLAQLADLRSQVSRAQADVNRLQSDINAKHRRIAELNAQIAAKERWRRSRPWWEAAWAAAVTAAYVAPRLGEISLLYAQIATLEAARIAALGVLEVAKIALRTVEITVANFVPIELDPRVAPLIALRVTAAAVFDAANLALEAIKLSVGALAAVGTQVIAMGANALVIRSASFATSLRGASGGSVTMRFEIVFLGQTIVLSLPFSFHNPLLAVDELVKVLLP